MSEEIKEIVDKLSNRKQETLIQGLRECQLKDIEHPFITKEEYIDKILNYIKDLQQKVEQLEKENKKLKYDCSCSFHDAEELNQKLTEIIDERNELDTKLIQLENIRKKAIELIKKYQRKDEFLNLNEWQTRDLLNILNKGSDKENASTN